VITLLLQAGVTPGGKPVGAPIPVAPVVVIVIGVSALLAHNEGVADGVPTVFKGDTVIVPVALTAPHPPVSGIV
jgi:hypothetical protein